MTARPLRILVTGSRNHWDASLIRREIVRAAADHFAHHNEDCEIDWAQVTIVHGAQAGRERGTGEMYGADWFAGQAARAFGATEERHPAEWERLGYAAGPVRNAEMVALGADVCLAFPLGESPGTRGCMELARKAGIPVVIHEGTTP